MALLPADVLDPAGPILAAWFPDEGDGSEGTTLHDRLALYLAEAYAAEEIENAPDADAAALRWVEWRVYGALQRRQAGAGGALKSVSLPDGPSFTYAGGGTEAVGFDWGRQAQYALSAWRLLTTAEEEQVEAATRWSLPA